MATCTWILREPPIEFREWLDVVGTSAEFKEVDEELAASKFGNLLHLVDSHNHWYWLGHPDSNPVPFSFTPWGVYLGRNDETTIVKAHVLAASLSATVNEP